MESDPTLEVTSTIDNFGSFTFANVIFLGCPLGTVLVVGTNLDLNKLGRCVQFV